MDVKNTGDFDGDEVVQIYMRTPDSPASLERPIKRLKGFQRVTIPKGQIKTVRVDINCSDLWFWDQNNDRLTFDQGRYLFEIGSSSKDIRGTVTATMSGSFIPVVKTIVADCGTIVLRNGSNVPTSVTAAMTDDSFYDITKAKVVYTSNNPAVAMVDEKGVVTAKGIGVATISAYVTIGDNTKSGSFPVKIMPDLNPASITVNNKKIPGFNPAIQGYSFLMQSSSAQAPIVNIIPADQAVGVETIQAKGVPGTATITLTDYVTIDKREYSINFGTKSVSDEFNGQVPGSQWSWERENKERLEPVKNPWFTGNKRTERRYNRSHKYCREYSSAECKY